mmetsp:Transcript_16157/g.40948  ORF Transcript_16157/g.40948 Transcript_16157/m.40948 type:complete len:228 (+) Transcript_16157:166-849(+)
MASPSGLLLLLGIDAGLLAAAKVARGELAAHELEHLVNEDDGQRVDDDQTPLLLGERHDIEHGAQRRNVENHEVQRERERHRKKKIHIIPGRDHQERAVLRQGVERVEHLDSDKDGERECAGLALAQLTKIVAAVDLVGEVAGRPRVGLELVGLAVHDELVGGGVALLPVHELLEGDRGVPILGQVEETEELVRAHAVHVPRSKSADGGEADVETDHNVAEEDPLAD